MLSLPLWEVNAHHHHLMTRKEKLRKRILSKTVQCILAMGQELSINGIFHKMRLPVDCYSNHSKDCHIKAQEPKCPMNGALNIRSP